MSIAQVEVSFNSGSVRGLYKSYLPLYKFQTKIALEEEQAMKEKIYLSISHMEIYRANDFYLLITMNKQADEDVIRRYHGERLFKQGPVGIRVNINKLLNLPPYQMNMHGEWVASKVQVIISDDFFSIFREYQPIN